MRVVIDHHSAATVTIGAGPGPDAADSPITNTQNSVRGEVWRNTDTDGIDINGSFADGTARPINTFAIFRHRLHGATIRLRLYDAVDQGGTTIYDSGSLNTIWWTPDTSGFNWGASGYDPFLTEAPFLLWLDQTYTAAKSYKITFSSFASTGPYWPTSDAWQISRIVLGAYMEPITGPALGASFGWDAVSASVRSVGGSLRTSQGQMWRTATLDLNAIRPEEARFWRDLVRHVGLWNDFVVTQFEGDGTVEERDYTWLVKFVALDALNRPGRVLTKKLQLQEV